MKGLAIHSRKTMVPRGGGFPACLRHAQPEDLLARGLTNTHEADPPDEGANHSDDQHDEESRSIARGASEE